MILNKQIRFNPSKLIIRDEENRKEINIVLMEVEKKFREYFPK